MKLLDIKDIAAWIA